MLTDSHCHLADEAFADDRDDVLRSAAASGVRRIVVIASDAEDALDIHAWLGAPGVEHHGVRLWSTAGVHPHYAERATPEALDRIETLLSSGPAVATGECGLDFHYDNAARDAQFAAFRAQCEIAERTGRPLVVHSRSADAEMRRVIEGLPDGVLGVLHCFTGGRELMDAALRRGWYVSLSGIVTFRRFADHELVRAIPEDRILIETDAPYLAPVPHRGRRNEPAFVARTCAAVAEMRGVEAEALAETTGRNAATLFDLSGED
jgi:TatD DNase family protein